MRLAIGVAASACDTGICRDQKESNIRGTESGGVTMAERLRSFTADVDSDVPSHIFDVLAVHIAMPTSSAFNCAFGERAQHVDASDLTEPQITRFWRKFSQRHDINPSDRRSQSYRANLPDFVRPAGTSGWTGLLVIGADKFDDAVDTMITTSDPALVDCDISQLKNCYVMLSSGAGHNEIVL